MTFLCYPISYHIWYMSWITLLGTCTCNECLLGLQQMPARTHITCMVTVNSYILHWIQPVKVWSKPDSLNNTKHLIYITLFIISNWWLYKLHRYTILPILQPSEVFSGRNTTVCQASRLSITNFFYQSTLKMEIAKEIPTFKVSK